MEIKVKREDIFRFFFLGFCSFVNVVGCILALSYIPATRLAVMQPSIPVIATVISVVIGMERLNTYKFFGIISAVVGAVLMEIMSTSGDISSPENTKILIGTFFTFCECVCMASLIVFQKPLLTKYSPPVLTCVYYSTGCFITVITTFMTGFTHINYKLSDFYFEGDFIIWACLLYASVFATLFTYNAYSYVSTIVAPSIVTIYSCAQPAWTSILAFIIYGNVISHSEVCGGLLIAIGLVLSVRGGIQEQVYDKAAPPIEKKDPLMSQDTGDVELAESLLLKAESNHAHVTHSAHHHSHHNKK